jgi:hypothetical protein
MKKIASDRNYRLIKRGGGLGARDASVWVVTLNIDYEGSTIQAVFSSEDKAKAAIKAAEPLGAPEFNFSINQFQLDKVPDGSGRGWRLAPADDDSEDFDEFDWPHSASEPGMDEDWAKQRDEQEGEAMKQEKDPLSQGMGRK